MQMLSCANCWYNPLQHDTIGLSVGYCVEHHVVLRRSDETTCGRQRRKDLSLPAVRAAHDGHRSQVKSDGVYKMKRQRTLVVVEPATEAEIEVDARDLQADTVGKVVSEYGELNAKIESLSQLRQIPGIRADIALFSLGRAYVNRCVDRGGSWTSGVHLLWWAGERLAVEPDVRPTDVRMQAPVTLERQIELATWSVLILRLTFIADVAEHAAATNGSPVATLRNLAERAAEETGNGIKAKPLLRWSARVARRALYEALPEDEYRRLAIALHKD
jgi:hypothetical protein